MIEAILWCYVDAVDSMREIRKDFLAWSFLYVSNDENHQKRIYIFHIMSVNY
jgi:hypothetical protein